MKIDLDRIPRDRPCAVSIPTPEHGEVFLAEMRLRYPKAVGSWHRAYFEKYRLKTGGNYYFPRLHTDYPSMTHGDAETYIERGVELIPFDAILVPEVELETCIGDMPIESLFG